MTTADIIRIIVDSILILVFTIYLFTDRNKKNKGD